MPETFLILWAGGVMLAAAISDPRAVVLGWLRLAGINALWMAGLAGFFLFRRDVVSHSSTIMFAGTVAFILAQLGFVQVAHRKTQRVFAMLAFLAAVAAGTQMLWQILPAPAASRANLIVLALSCGLIAATSGIALMDMLLGHAYLNAAQMTMAPFLRMNRAFAAVMFIHAALSIIGTFLLHSLHPMEMFWNVHGLYIGTRWLIGFAVAAVFIYMAHDCIKRRATQSATGILYVTGVLIFIGEMIGLYVMSETGMPV